MGINGLNKQDRAELLKKAIGDISECLNYDNTQLVSLKNNTHVICSTSKEHVQQITRDLELCNKSILALEQITDYINNNRETRIEKGW